MINGVGFLPPPRMNPIVSGNNPLLIEPLIQEDNVLFFLIFWKILIKFWRKLENFGKILKETEITKKF